MAIYFYWGEDDFALNQAVNQLKQKVVDPDWSDFNYEKISSDQTDAVIQALSLVMTPPFGSGGRLVWVADTTLGQQCSEVLLRELERTLPQIPDRHVLLLTSPQKPDGRLKSTKLLQNLAEIQEFALIPPWKTDDLIKKVQQVAKNTGVKLTADGWEFLAQSIGNDTRQLHNELEKLHCFVGKSGRAITLADLHQLVTTTTQNSLQLAAAIRQGEVAIALELVADLLRRNEPALRIVATLVGQFRTWLWVKLMVSSGECDERAIAQVAEVANPKRVHFLQREIQAISLSQLKQALPLLLELEFHLKQGADPEITLQSKVIELCQVMLSPTSKAKFN